MSSYQQIHAHKPLFGKKGKLLNLEHLDFDACPERSRMDCFHRKVSCGEFAYIRLQTDRASYFVFFVSRYEFPLYICRESSTNQHFFMQNKPNLGKAKMNNNNVL